MSESSTQRAAQTFRRRKREKKTNHFSFTPSAIFLQILPQTTSVSSRDTQVKRWTLPLENALAINFNSFPTNRTC